MAEEHAFIGKLIVVNRGPIPMADGTPGVMVLVGGLLGSESPVLTPEVVAAGTSEQWDVVVNVQVLAKRRGLTCQKGDLSHLLIGGINNPHFWEETFNPDQQTWE